MLQATWHEDSIIISKDNKVLTSIASRRIDRGGFIHGTGNWKTKRIVGMINNISNGCFRSLTGVENCNTPCYGACYANCSVYARMNSSEFDITNNGINNSLFLLNVTDNYELKSATKIWRIGSESSDMSLALALGMVEPWLKANPKKIFTGISSNHFCVPAEELKKLSEYDNLIVGHTVSTWFGKKDLDNRFRQIRKFQKYNIPIMVWVVSRSDWKDNTQLMKRVLNHVSPEQVIEVPFHEKGKYDKEALSYVNPHGICCETGKCVDCKVLCGARYLRSLKKS